MRTRITESQLFMGIGLTLLSIGLALWMTGCGGDSAVPTTPRPVEPAPAETPKPPQVIYKPPPPSQDYGTWEGCSAADPVNLPRVVDNELYGILGTGKGVGVYLQRGAKILTTWSFEDVGKKIAEEVGYSFLRRRDFPRSHQDEFETVISIFDEISDDDHDLPSEPRILVDGAHGRHSIWYEQPAWGAGGNVRSISDWEAHYIEVTYEQTGACHSDNSDRIDACFRRVVYHHMFHLFGFVHADGTANDVVRADGKNPNHIDPDEHPQGIRMSVELSKMGYEPTDEDWDKLRCLMEQRGVVH